MDAVVTYEDSLKLLRIARIDTSLALVPARPDGFSGPAPTCCNFDMRLLRAALPESFSPPTPEAPLHLAFPSRSARTKSSCIVPTAVLNELPEDAFLEVVRVDGTPLAEGLNDRVRLFVEAPGLSLVRMAHHLGRRVAAGTFSEDAALIRLAGLGMEFCGSFARDPQNPGRGVSTFDLPAVGCAQDILRLLDSLPRLRGLRLARKAASYVRDDSGSPHETLLSLAYRLPPKMGGAEFAEPLANAPLVWPDQARARGILKHQSMRPDFHWPQYLLASEYLGGVHGKPSSLAEDSNRIQDYQSCDYSVFPATYEDVRNTQALGSYLARLARVMATYEGEDFARRMERVLLDPDVRQARAVLIAHLLPPWA